MKLVLGIIIVTILKDPSAFQIFDSSFMRGIGGFSELRVLSRMNIGVIYPGKGSRSTFPAKQRWRLELPYDPS